MVTVKLKDARGTYELPGGDILKGKETATVSRNKRIKSALAGGILEEVPTPPAEKKKPEAAPVPAPGEPLKP